MSDENQHSGFSILDNINKLITEHGSAEILKERIAQLRELMEIRDVELAKALDRIKELEGHISEKVIPAEHHLTTDQKRVLVEIYKAENPISYKELAAITNLTEYELKDICVFLEGIDFIRIAQPHRPTIIRGATSTRTFKEPGQSALFRIEDGGREYLEE